MLRTSAMLLVAFVVISSLADRGANRERVITGTVVEWRADQSIKVVNQASDPRGFQIALRNTIYDGDPAAIRPGVRVTVWFKLVGERAPLAARVQVHR
jgi:hypothetical protein